LCNKSSDIEESGVSKSSRHGAKGKWWLMIPIIITFIIIIIKGIYIAQVRKGHKCAMSAEMAVWLSNCLYLYSYLHN